MKHLEEQRQRQRSVEAEGRLLAAVDSMFGPPPVFRGDYRGLDFSHGNWSEVDFSHSDCSEADFRDADLRNANFAGACLRKANLTAARFWNADLTDADLTDACGLIPGQLAGADLTFARLPAEVAKLPALEYVKSISENAAKVFLTILALVAFVLLTIVSTPDSQLFLNTSGAKLPLIDISVPILSFLVAAPLLLLSFYLYFNLYLQRLWEALAALPAVLPDGRRLDEATYPWLINDLCRNRHPRLCRRRHDPRHRRVLAARVQTATSLFLVYWMVPLLIWGVWVKGQRAKLPELTGFHIVLFTVGVALAIWFRRLMKRTFAARRHPQGMIPLHPLGAFWALLPLGMGVVLAYWSHGIYTATQAPSRWTTPEQLLALQEPRPLSWRWLQAAGTCLLPHTSDPEFWQRWGSHLLLTLRLQPYAIMDGVEFCTKPNGWTGASDVAALELPRVVGFNWQDRNLAHVRFHDCVLIRLKLFRCSLVQTDFTGADLRLATFETCDATNADFDQVQFASGVPDQAVFEPPRGVPLSEPHANSFRDTLCDHASFNNANMRGIKIQNSSFEEATLSESDLHEAKFVDCNFFKASFALADLRGATFSGSLYYRESVTADRTKLLDFQGADFLGVRGRDVDFGSCSLRGAIFNEADLEGADFSGAADLQPNQLLDAQCLRDVILPSGMDLDTADGKKLQDRIKTDPVVPDQPGRPTVPRRHRVLDSGGQNSAPGSDSAASPQRHDPPVEESKSN